MLRLRRSIQNQKLYLINAIFCSPRFLSRSTAMLFALSISSAPLLSLIVFIFTRCSNARHVTLQPTNVTSIPQRVSSPSPLNETLTAPDIDCNETYFGRDLNLASCLVAISKIDTTSPTFDTEKTWGQRGTGDFDIGLPQRYIGRKYLSVLLKGHGGG